MWLFIRSKPDQRNSFNTPPNMKKAVELPANVIVIFIIAVMVLLGLIMFFFNNYIKLSPSIIGLSKNTSEDIREVLPCNKLSEQEISTLCRKACSEIDSSYSYADEYNIINIVGVIKCKCNKSSGNQVDIKYVEVKCQ